MQEWIIGTGIVVAVAAFLRFMPKAKIVGFLKPKCYAAGVFISKFLILRLGKSAAERVEEGLIVTITMAISESIGGFVDGLLMDNKTKKEKKPRGEK